MYFLGVYNLWISIFLISSFYPLKVSLVFSTDPAKRQQGGCSHGTHELPPVRWRQGRFPGLGDGNPPGTLKPQLRDLIFFSLKEFAPQQWVDWFSRYNFLPWAECRYFYCIYLHKDSIWKVLYTYSRCTLCLVWCCWRNPGTVFLEMLSAPGRATEALQVDLRMKCFPKSSVASSYKPRAFPEVGLQRAGVQYVCRMRIAFTGGEAEWCIEMYFSSPCWMSSEIRNICFIVAFSCGEYNNITEAQYEMSSRSFEVAAWVVSRGNSAWVTSF